MKKKLVYTIIIIINLVLINASFNKKTQDNTLIEERTIPFNELFNQKEKKYLVLVYSSTCIACRDTLKIINAQIIKKNLIIFGINTNEDAINYTTHYFSNIGKSKSEEVYIYSTPTLFFIIEATIQKEVRGFDNIRKENLYIFFEENILICYN